MRKEYPSMDAIVTAGGIPLPEDPLYTYTQGHSKAMLDVAGKPMIQWVLDALGGARDVDQVVVIGLTEKSGLSCAKPLSYIPNQGGMLANVLAGIGKDQESTPAPITSCLSRPTSLGSSPRWSTGWSRPQWRPRTICTMVSSRAR
jgi:hypothetical protein